MSLNDFYDTGIETVDSTSVVNPVNTETNTVGGLSDFYDNTPIDINAKDLGLIEDKSMLPKDSIGFSLASSYPTERSFYGNTKEDIYRGISRQRLYRMRLENKAGLVSDEELDAARKQIWDLDKLDPVTRDNVISKTWGSIMGMLPIIGGEQQARMLGALAGGATDALKGAVIGTGVEPIGGVGTVAGGAIGLGEGVLVGQQIGSIAYWQNSLSEDIYQQLVESGMDKATADKYSDEAAIAPALAFSVGYGAILGRTKILKKLSPIVKDLIEKYETKAVAGNTVDILTKSSPEIASASANIAKQTVSPFVDKTLGSRAAQSVIHSIEGSAAVGVGKFTEEVGIKTAEVIEGMIETKDIPAEFGDAILSGVRAFNEMLAPSAFIGAVKLSFGDSSKWVFQYAKDKYKQVQQRARHTIIGWDIKGRDRLDQLKELEMINPLTPAEITERNTLLEMLPEEKPDKLDQFIYDVRGKFLQKEGKFGAEEHELARMQIEGWAKKEGLTTDEWLDNYIGGPVEVAKDYTKDTLLTIEALKNAPLDQFKQALEDAYAARDIHATPEQVEKAKYDVEFLERVAKVRGDISVVGELSSLGTSAGRFGNQNNVKTLMEAARLEREGKSSKEVRKATNWERGVDNDWVCRIDPSAVELKFTQDEYTRVKSRKQVTISAKDLLNETEILNIYPTIKDYNVKFDTKLDYGTAYYDADNLLFVLGTKGIKGDDISIGNSLKTSMTHEIEHHIMDISGQDKSADKDIMLPIGRFSGKIDTWTKALAQNKADVARLEEQKLDPKNKSKIPLIEVALEHKKENIKAFEKNLADLESDPSRKNATYFKTIGEVNSYLTKHMDALPIEIREAKTIREHAVDMLRKRGVFTDTDTLENTRLFTAEESIGIPNRSVSNKIRDYAHGGKGGKADAIRSPYVEATIRFNAERKAIITAFQAPNFATFLHEMHHIMFLHLEPAQLEVLSKRYDVSAKLMQRYIDSPSARNFTQDEWNNLEHAQESFVSDYSSYVMDAVAPIKTLRPLFEQLKETLRGYYLQMPPQLVSVEMRQIFDSFMVSDRERFGGNIFTKDGKFEVKKAVIDGKETAVIYVPVTDKNGLPLEKDNDITFGKDEQGNFTGFMQVPVDNLIRGNRLTSDVDNMIRDELDTSISMSQKQVLGTGAIWRSDLMSDEKPITRSRSLPLALELTASDISSLSAKELLRAASKLGLRGRELGGKEISITVDGKKTVDLENRKELEARIIQVLNENRRFLSEELDQHEVADLLFQDAYSKRSIGGKIVDKFGDMFGGWFMGYVDRIKFSNGGGATQDIEHSAAKRVTDIFRNKKGPVEKARVIVMDLTSGKEGRKALRDLNTLVVLDEIMLGGVRARILSNRLSLGLDEKTREKYGHLTTFTEREQQVIDAVRNVNKITGKMAEDAGMKIFFKKLNKETGNWERTEMPFKAQWDRVNRHSTSLSYWLMNADTKMAKATRYALTRLWARINPELDADHVMASLNEYRHSSKVDQIGLEHDRKINIYGTHIQIGDAKPMELIKADARRYVTEEYHATPARVAFAQEYGQDAKAINARLDAFSQAGGNRVDLERALLSLQGMPTWRVPKFDPGSIMWEISGGYTDLAMIAKVNLLGPVTTIVNIPQTLITLSAQVGYSRFLKACGKVGIGVPEFMVKKVMDRVRNTNKADATFVASVLDSQRYIAGYAIHTPDNVFRGATKIQGEELSTWDKAKGYLDRKAAVDYYADKMMWYQGVTPINKWNDFLSIAAAKQLVEALQAGKGTAFDRERLAALMYTKEQIAVMMSGEKQLAAQAKPLYDSVYARVAQQGQGSDLSKAQKSHMANFPGYSNTVIFDTYARTFTMYHWWLWHQATRPGITAKQRAFRYAQLGTFIGGVAASGFASLVMLNMAKTGINNTKKMLFDWDDNDDGEVDNDERIAHMSELIGKSLITAAISGPGAVLLNKMEQNNNSVKQSLLDSTLPGSMADSWDLLTGNGEYEGLAEYDRARMWLLRNSSLSRFARTTVGLFGLGAYNPDLEIAMKKYYAFEQRYIPKRKGGTDSAPSILHNLEGYLRWREQRQFRSHMKRINELMKASDNYDGRGEKIRREIEKAMAIGTSAEKPWTSIADAIRKRKVITKEIVEQYSEQFLKEVGVKNAKLIMEYDQMLENLAEGQLPE